LDALKQEAMAIDALTLPQYHSLCYWDLSQTRRILILNPATVNLGTVIQVSSDQSKTAVHDQIASLENVKVFSGGWCGAAGQVMTNGWTRYFISFGWWILQY
jgi:hypothetical protein